MFKRLLGGLSGGGVTVDTRLEADQVDAGSEVAGTVHIRGGSADWDAQTLTVELITRVWIEGDDGRRIDGTIVSASAAVHVGQVPADEELTFPFVLEVPAETPLTAGFTRSFVRTRLALDYATDPTDEDALVICPNPVMQAVLDAVEACGFRFHEAETEYNRRRENPIVQEFDYRPVSGNRNIEEVEVSFRPNGTSLEVSVTVDMKPGFFRSGRERTRKFSVSARTLGSTDLRGKIRDIIDALAY